MAWGTEPWVFGEVLGCSPAPEQLCPRAADLKISAQHWETSSSEGPPSSVATLFAELGFDARGGSPRPPSLEVPRSLGGEASGSGRVPSAVITVTGDSGTKAGEEVGPQGDCPGPAVCPGVRTLKASSGDGSKRRRLRPGAPPGHPASPRPPPLTAEGVVSARATPAARAVVNRA